jgi:hypothetical protein
MKTADPARMYVLGDPSYVARLSQSTELPCPVPHENGGPRQDVHPSGPQLGGQVVSVN